MSPVFRRRDLFVDPLDDRRPPEAFRIVAQIPFDHGKNVEPLRDLEGHRRIVQCAFDDLNRVLLPRHVFGMYRIRPYKTQIGVV